MRHILYVLIVASASVIPTELADVPIPLRQHNWGTWGSCAHASTVTALRYHGQPAMASWWRANYAGGETIYGLREKLTAARIPYSYTITGDMQWMEWAVRNRMCVVLFHVPWHHCVNLVDMTGDTVTIIDNNQEGYYVKMSRQEFYNTWWISMRNSSNPVTRNSAGWALAICLPPPPPWPDLSNLHQKSAL